VAKEPKKISSLCSFSFLGIWREEKKRKFPRRRKLGERSVFWIYSEIMKWIDSKK